MAIAVVSLADTISTSSAFAARSGQTVDGNREMIGIGAANFAAGLFQGFPVSTSGSRTAVAVQAGAKTQVTGLVGAAAITLILLLAPGLLRNLPQPTLAAVVIAASLSLADLKGTARLYRLRRTEFLLSMAAFLGVVLLGVLPGIALAVALSIGNVFRRAWWPYQAILGRAPGVPGYHDVSSYPMAERLAGWSIFRFDAPVFFANARTFREQVRALADAEPRPLWIVVAAEPITDVDTTAADMLLDLELALNADGVKPGVRRDEGPGAPQDRPLRADRDDRAVPFLPHVGGRGRGVPKGNGGAVGPGDGAGGALTGWVTAPSGWVFHQPDQARSRPWKSSVCSQRRHGLLST